MLFKALGESKILDVLNIFYENALKDPLIGHLFLGLTKESLVAKQLRFTSHLLGGPLPYEGPHLRKAHERLHLKEVHVKRRGVLMEDAMKEANLSPEQIQEWLQLEERISHLVLKPSVKPCNEP